MSVLSIDGIRVEFPYEAYDCQRTFMEKVIAAIKNKENAALESPTGTGKTLCLLCGAIAFVKELKSKLTVDPDGQIQGTSRGCLYPKILYASRTHSQLAQVVRELNKTIYKDTVTVTLGSRDMLCVNEKVAKETTTAAKSLMCRLLVKQRRCHFYNQLEKQKDQVDKLFAENGNVPDIEDLVKAGKKYSMCPFYYVRNVFEQADLILLPYNYIVDPRLRHLHNVNLQGNIVIFDEAHNLESACEESVSVSLSSTEISGCIREAKMVLQAVIDDDETIRTQMDNTDLPFGQTTEEKKERYVEKNDVAHLLEKLQAFESTVDELNKAGAGGRPLPRIGGRVFPGKKIIDLLEKASIRKDVRDEIGQLVDHICQFLTHKGSEEGGGGGTLWKEKGIYLQQFSSFVSTVYADAYDPAAALGEPSARRAILANNHRVSMSTAENFQLYVTTEGDAVSLNYWCFSPAVAMRYLHMRGVRSIVLTSGTLSPLDAFVDALGVDVALRLENPHVASKEQLIAACIRADPAGHLICGTYNNRSKDEYLLGIGAIVERVCEKVPEGVLVFFPSYVVMNLCINKWKTTTAGASLWARMSNSKKLFEEPRSKSEVKLVMAQFCDAVRQDGGAALFAVCRAKISEGIDFSDCESRAVVIVGIPFAPTTNPRVELKKQHLNEMRANAAKRPDMSKKVISSDEWYQVDAVRAVNQAMGRVLRHKDDFGIVVLADSRYASMNLKRFPSWLRESVKKFEKFDDFEPVCCRFFRDFGLKAKPSSSYVSTSFNAALLGSSKDASSSRKRKAEICSSGTRLSNDGTMKGPDVGLGDIEGLYGGAGGTPKRPEQLLFPESDKPVKTGSALARIEELSEKGCRNEKAPTVAVEIFSSAASSFSQPVASSAKKIRLKPNSSVSSMSTEDGMAVLKNCRRTPIQFVHLLKAMNISRNRRDVQRALKEYVEKKKLDSLVGDLERATLPSNPEVFKAVFGFLDDCDKPQFVYECRRLRLI